MTKLKNTDIDVQNVIDRIGEGHKEAILYGINSDIPIINFNAIHFGTKYGCREPEFIEALEKKFINSDIKFFGIELKKFVVAALDVLEIQKYTGDDELIKKLIDSDFEF